MKQYSIKNPPALPASCPPLPAGQVHLGRGETFDPLPEGSFFTGYARSASDPDARWVHHEWASDPLDHYAAPEGSQIVKLNFGEPLGSWADKLPREYVDLALKRRASDGNPGELIGGFLDLFEWAYTPEGGAFWNAVDDFVRGAASTLPTIPAATNEKPCDLPTPTAPKEKPLTTAERVRRIAKKLEEQDALLASIQKLITDFNASNS